MSTKQGCGSAFSFQLGNRISVVLWCLESSSFSLSASLSEVTREPALDPKEELLCQKDDPSETNLESRDDTSGRRRLAALATELDFLSNRESAIVQR